MPMQAEKKNNLRFGIYTSKTYIERKKENKTFFICA